MRERCRRESVWNSKIQAVLPTIQSRHRVRITQALMIYRFTIPKHLSLKTSSANHNARDQTRFDGKSNLHASQTPSTIAMNQNILHGMEQLERPRFATRDWGKVNYAEGEKGEASHMDKTCQKYISPYFIFILRRQKAIVIS